MNQVLTINLLLFFGNTFHSLSLLQTDTREINPAMSDYGRGPNMLLFYRIKDSASNSDNSVENSIYLEMLGVRSCGGLVVVDATGIIRHYNNTMVEVMLGYHQDNVLVGKVSINYENNLVTPSYVIPNSEQH